MRLQLTGQIAQSYLPCELRACAVGLGWLKQQVEFLENDDPEARKLDNAMPPEKKRPNKWHWTNEADSNEMAEETKWKEARRIAASAMRRFAIR